MYCVDLDIWLYATFKFVWPVYRAFSSRNMVWLSILSDPANLLATRPVDIPTYRLTVSFKLTAALQQTTRCFYCSEWSSIPAPSQDRIHHVFSWARVEKPRQA